MGYATESIPLYALHVGHIIRHDGEFKIVEGMSVGYPYLGAEWSKVITFTDSTQLVVPWPDANTTIEVVSRFGTFKVVNRLDTPETCGKPAEFVVEEMPDGEVMRVCSAHLPETCRRLYHYEYSPTVTMLNETYEFKCEGKNS